MKIQKQYGPWAIIAGASEGIGKAFARTLAAKGLHLVLIARGEEGLERVSREIRKEYPVNVRSIVCDLSEKGCLQKIAAATEELHIGLLVYNAALADTGPFLNRNLKVLEEIVLTNCMGPLRLCRHFGEQMAGQGRGGIILLSSMSGFQGTPYVAAYGATKAFNLVLAEGLWYELKSQGVDVLACCPGPTSTPGFNSSLGRQRPPAFPPVLTPEQVAKESLKYLGRRSVIVPALPNRLASFFIQKLLPRHTGVKLMGKSTGRLYGSG